MNSFGLLLREYRNRSIDPKTGKRLSQERLAVLMGEILGTTYTSQAISDWERDKSQIHKDHRQVLCALIQTLHQCGGLSSLDDAEKLLVAGNYRGLSHSEAEAIFLMESPAPPPSVQQPAQAPILKNLLRQRNILSPIMMVKAVSLILSWLATWLALAPCLDFSLLDLEQLRKIDITMVFAALAIPAILSWLINLEASSPPPFPVRFLNFFGGILGYTLGSVNLLTIALLSYNLYLYPWPTGITLIFSIWPAALGIVSAKLYQAHIYSSPGEVHLRDLRSHWAMLGLPPALGMVFYYLHPLVYARIWGSFLLILLSIGLGILFWAQTRKTR